MTSYRIKYNSINNAHSIKGEYLRWRRILVMVGIVDVIGGVSWINKNIKLNNCTKNSLSWKKTASLLVLYTYVCMYGILLIVPLRLSIRIYIKSDYYPYWRQYDAIYFGDTWSYPFWRQYEAIHSGDNIKLSIPETIWCYPFWRQYDDIHSGENMKLFILGTTWCYAFWSQ